MALVKTSPPVVVTREKKYALSEWSKINQRVIELKKERKRLIAEVCSDIDIEIAQSEEERDQFRDPILEFMNMTGMKRLEFVEGGCICLVKTKRKAPLTLDVVCNTLRDMEISASTIKKVTDRIESKIPSHETEYLKSA